MRALSRHHPTRIRQRSSAVVRDNVLRSCHLTRIFIFSRSRARARFFSANPGDNDARKITRLTVTYREVRYRSYRDKCAVAPSRHISRISQIRHFYRIYRDIARHYFDPIYGKSLPLPYLERISGNFISCFLFSQSFARLFHRI